MKKTIVFDFDGTIADSLRASLEIYNRIAPLFKVLPIEEKRIETFKSDKIQRFFKYLKISYIKLPFMVLKGRSEFKKNINAIKEQPGVCDVIRRLKDDGHTLGILTSNSKNNVTHLMRNYGIDHCFDFIENSKHMFGKDKYIKRIMKEQGTQKENLFFVADETRDIESANKVGVNMIAVTWGFQNRRAFRKAQATYIVDTPDELYSLF